MMITKEGRENLTTCTYYSTDPLAETGCFDADSIAVKVSRIIPYVFIMAVSIAGNILVAVVVLRVRSMRKAINFFILNMAISDLLITLVYMPRVVSILMAGYKWLSNGAAGLVFCKMVYFIHETALSVSIFSAVCISGERFLAVIRPLKSLANNTKPARYLIFFSWAASAAVRLPILLANKTTKESCGNYYCELHLEDLFGAGSTVVYHKFNLIGMYATPLGVMVALYSATIFTLRRRNRPGNTIATEATSLPEILNRKVSRMVLVVITAFLLCWLLYFIVAVMQSYEVSIPCNVLYVRLLLAHFNCALTPVLYAVFSENYNREFKNVLFGSPWFRKSRVRTRTFNMDQDLDAKLGELGSRGFPRQRLETATEVI